MKKTATKRFVEYGFCELRQIDPEKNRRRYYCIEVQPGLFDVSVQRCWGRLGTKPRTLWHYFDDIKDALKAANMLYSQKLTKGYAEYPREITYAA